MLFCNLLRMNTPRKKLLSDKRGQGSLIAVILASAVGTIIIGSATQWYLSMHKNIDGMDNRLEAMTIAMSEWQRLEHMSLDELENNRTNYQNPWSVGDKYKVSVELGEQGTFDEGKCNALTGSYAGDTPNCFRDTIMKVYDSTTNNVLYTTRSLPLTAGGGDLFKLGDYQSVPWSGIAPKTGFLMVHRHDGGYGTFNIKIDGVTRAYGDGDGSYGGSTHLYTIPIKKGSSYAVSGAGLASIAFVPIKGLGADNGSSSPAPPANNNVYVYNDDQSDRISMKYDPETNMIHSYANGQEVSIGINTPDWANPKRLVSSSAGWGARTIVYDKVMEETGYIKLLNCVTSIDYDVYVNATDALLQRVLVDDTTVHQAAYHKCTATGSETYSFLIHKGDRVTFFYRFGAINFAGVNGTTMSFIPIRMNQTF